MTIFRAKKIVIVKNRLWNAMRSTNDTANGKKAQNDITETTNNDEWIIKNVGKNDCEKYEWNDKKFIFFLSNYWQDQTSAILITPFGQAKFEQKKSCQWIVLNLKLPKEERILTKLCNGISGGIGNIINNSSLNTGCNICYTLSCSCWFGRS